jgi:hypothetical protein
MHISNYAHHWFTLKTCTYTQKPSKKAKTFAEERGERLQQFINILSDVKAYSGRHSMFTFSISNKRDNVLKEH